MRAQLQGAHLIGAQLQGANLSRAQLQGAYLSVAELQGADLREAQMQGADLSVAGLQGADLSEAQLQGAVLSMAQLQGADLRKAQMQGVVLQMSGLWNVQANSDTQLALADLRDVDFDADRTDRAKAKLLAAIPELSRALVEEALRPRVGARTLPRVGTQAGPAMVDVPRLDGLRTLTDMQVTADETEYKAKLVPYLAEHVATTAPEAAETLAYQAIHPAISDGRHFGPDLGCRLLALAAARTVKLEQATIDALQQQFGKCPS